MCYDFISQSLVCDCVHGHAKRNRQKEQSMYYIGIDLGTSAVKLLLMEGNGKIVRVTSREVSAVLPASGLVAAKPGRLVQAVHGRAL